MKKVPNSDPRIVAMRVQTRPAPIERADAGGHRGEVDVADEPDGAEMGDLPMPLGVGDIVDRVQFDRCRLAGLGQFVVQGR